MTSAFVPTAYSRHLVNLVPESITVYANLTGAARIGLPDSDTPLMMAIRSGMRARYFEYLENRDPYNLEEHPEPGHLPYEREDVLKAYPVELRAADCPAILAYYSFRREVWDLSGSRIDWQSNRFNIPAYVRVVVQAAEQSGMFRRIEVRSDRPGENWFVWAETLRYVTRPGIDLGDYYSTVVVCQWGKYPRTIAQVVKYPEIGKQRAAEAAALEQRRLTAAKRRTMRAWQAIWVGISLTFFVLMALECYLVSGNTYWPVCLGLAVAIEVIAHAILTLDLAKVPQSQRDRVASKTVI